MKIGTLDNFFTQLDNVHLWQYSNAPYLTALLDSHIQWFKNATQEFWTDWHRDVFTLDTANSFGLEVWGNILGVKRPASVPQNYVVDASNILKFYNANSKTWHSIWLSGATSNFSVETNPAQGVEYSIFPIPDEMYRRCLKAKIFLLYSNYSVPDINRFLKYLFSNKSVYVRDNLDMTMDIIFNFIPTDVELSIITFEDFAPRPAGVKMNYGINLINDNTFGFEENKIGTWADNRDMPPVPGGYGTYYNL